MFTGIVTDLGQVRAVEERGDRRFTFATGYPAGDLSLGASIACSGACLTVVDFGEISDPDAGGARSWFAADVSAETLSKTTLGDWRVGTPVNFERALKLGDEFGGHLVSGHVDGLAKVMERRPEGDSQRFVFAAPAALAPFIAPKGSVALDGVSCALEATAAPDAAGTRAAAAAARAASGNREAPAAREHRTRSGSCNSSRRASYVGSRSLCRRTLRASPKQ